MSFSCVDSKLASLHFQVRIDPGSVAVGPPDMFWYSALNNAADVSMEAYLEEVCLRSFIKFRDKHEKRQKNKFQGQISDNENHFGVMLKIPRKT